MCAQYLRRVSKKSISRKKGRKEGRPKTTSLFNHLKKIRLSGPTEKPFRPSVCFTRFGLSLVKLFRRCLLSRNAFAPLESPSLSVCVLLLSLSLYGWMDDPGHSLRLSQKKSSRLKAKSFLQPACIPEDWFISLLLESIQGFERNVFCLSVFRESKFDKAFFLSAAEVKNSVYIRKHDLLFLFHARVELPY